MKGSANLSTIANLMSGERGRSVVTPEFRNLTLFRFGVVFTIVVAVFSVTFHGIMALEGREYSWFTGVYWTLTTMSTLGFGDIVFQSDLGHVFSMVVLAAGVVLLLIVLPLAFIRFFSTWQDTQLRTKVPTRTPARISGHVIISTYDDVTDELIRRLALSGVKSAVIESDPVRATVLYNDDKVPVVRGDPETPVTYERCAFPKARLLLANATDLTNTNTVLAARELSERIPIVATARNPREQSVLELAGASLVVLPAQWLGRHLANRVSLGGPRVLTIGHYKGVAIAEFTIHNTRLAGKTLKDTGVRRHTGVTISAVAKRGQLEAARPDTVLREDGIGVAVGSVAQVEALNGFLGESVPGNGRVLVIGGGSVGLEVARALCERGAPVRVVERDATLRDTIEEVVSDVVIGDVTDERVLRHARIDTAASVVLTARDDAVNIFLAVYFRKLNPETIIVSRVTHPATVEAVHRAGADFAVSDSQIKIQSVLGVLRNREPMIFGEGLDLFTADVPQSLAGKMLRESGILARTGLAVIAVERDGVANPHPRPDHVIRRRERLIFVGTASQRDEFERVFKK